VHGLVLVELLDLTEEVLGFNSAASLQASAACLRQHIRIAWTLLHALHDHPVGIAVVTVLHVHSADLVGHQQEPACLVLHSREEPKHLVDFPVQNILGWGVASSGQVVPQDQLLFRLGCGQCLLFFLVFLNLHVDVFEQTVELINAVSIVVRSFSVFVSTHCNHVLTKEFFVADRFNFLRVLLILLRLAETIEHGFCRSQSTLILFALEVGVDQALVVEDRFVRSEVWVL